MHNMTAGVFQRKFKSDLKTVIDDQTAAYKVIDNYEKVMHQKAL